jgi:putative membrane-bound dehydrogenase-like protein
MTFLRKSFLLVSTLISTAPLPLSANSSIQSPEESKNQFKLSDGFVIELVASEKDGVINPIDLTFDDAGRLWTQTASMYPLDPANLGWGALLKLMNDSEKQKTDPEFQRIRGLYEGRTKGKDKILIIEDPTADTPQISTFADGLTIPQSILPYKNGVFVAHGSQMIFLNDSNGDGKADKRDVVLDGFGFTDTHTLSHSLVRAPGGWINFSQGALNKGEVTTIKSGHKMRMDYCKTARFSLDGNILEPVTIGIDNIWGYQLRASGQWYDTCANDRGFSVMPKEPMTVMRGIGGDSFRSYNPYLPETHKFRVGGTGISGLAFNDDTAGSFPKEWNNVAFLANPITSSINAVRIVRKANGAVEATHLANLLTSQDKNFRPVNIEFGPDGCLYIADFCNKIIGHNEVSNTHPERDRKHGRIWRIRHKDQKPRSTPNFYKASNNDLVKHLSAPSLWAKRAAWHQIADRQAKELIPSITQVLANQQQHPYARIVALWSLESLQHFDFNLMSTLLEDSNADIRREAARALVNMNPNLDDFVKLLRKIRNDKNVMVYNQLLRSLNDFNQANSKLIDLLVGACREDLPGNALSQGYQRKFERYLARKALEKYKAELKDFINSDATKKHPQGNIIWASQALDKIDQEKVFIDLWTQMKNSELDKALFLIIGQAITNPTITKLVEPYLKKNSERTFQLALMNSSLVQSNQMNDILAPIIKTKLHSSNLIEINRAINAIHLFKLTRFDQDILQIYAANKAEKNTVKNILKILKFNSKKHTAFYEEILNDTSASFELKKDVLFELVLINRKNIDKVKPFYVSSSADQKLELLELFASSLNGTHAIFNLIHSKDLAIADLPITTGERIAQQNRLRQNPTFIAIVKDFRKRQSKASQKSVAKLSRFTALAAKRGGDASQGKPLFQALCMGCHSVGGQGADFAPPLDGSSHRDDHGLLTAILDPSAAIEGGYSLYRISKKDGSTIEGYMEKKDSTGTTMRFMGGAKLFIPTNEIQSQKFINGRSVMPNGLIDALGDKQIEDVLAYIRTLK